MVALPLCHAVRCQERDFAVNRLAFSPAAPQRLATAGADGGVALWDVQRRIRTAMPVAPPADGGGVPVAALAFSRGGEYLAYARSDDWTGGEARYEALCAAGHKNDICVVPVPKPPQ